MNDARRRTFGRPEREWRTSSYSQNGGQCVEVSDLDGVSAVRDTKNRHLGHMTFAAPEWRAFIDATKHESF